MMGGAPCLLRGLSKPEIAPSCCLESANSEVRSDLESVKLVTPTRSNQLTSVRVRWGE